VTAAATTVRLSARPRLAYAGRRQPRQQDLATGCHRSGAAAPGRPTLYQWHRLRAQWGNELGGVQPRWAPRVQQAALCTCSAAWSSKAG